MTFLADGKHHRLVGVSIGRVDASEPKPYRPAYAIICNMKRTTIFLDEHLERELKTLAGRSDRPMASLVREALAEYVVKVRATTSKPMAFVAAGHSGRRDTAERHEELLWKSAARKGRR